MTRVRFVLAALSASAVSAGALIAACGGDTDAPAEVVDAGVEAAAVVDTGAPDTGKPDTGAGCDTSGDFTNDIPDAALGGVSTTGVCTQCLRQNCGTTIDSCNKDCNCRAFVGAVLKCVQEGGKTVEQCALSSKVSPTTKTLQIAQGLSPCLQKCNDPCAVDELADAGRDAQ